MCITETLNICYPWQYPCVICRTGWLNTFTRLTPTLAAVSWTFHHLRHSFRRGWWLNTFTRLTRTLAAVSWPFQQITALVPYSPLRVKTRLRAVHIRANIAFAIASSCVHLCVPTARLILYSTCQYVVELMHRICANSTFALWQSKCFPQQQWFYSRLCLNKNKIYQTVCEGGNGTRSVRILP